MPNKKTVSNRCAHCGGPFGLQRHRRHGRQFCSSKCTSEFEIKVYQPSIVLIVSRGFEWVRRLKGARIASQQQ